MTDRPTDQQLDDWQTLADAATPGPWTADSSIPYGHRVGSSDESDWVAWTGDHGETGSEADAAYIAAMDPETAKALVAEVRRLNAVLEQIRHLHKDSPMGPCPVCIDADALAAGGDGLVPYPCPTGRLAGAQDCDPPHMRAAEETHVVADDSDDPEHTDDCPGCEAFTLTGHVAAVVGVVSAANEDQQ